MIELVAAVPPFGRTTTGMSTPRSEPFARPSVTLFLRGEPVIDRREADGNLSTSDQSRSPIWSSFVMRT